MGLPNVTDFRPTNSGIKRKPTGSVLSEEVRALSRPSEPPRSIPRVRCDLPPSVALPAVSGTGSRSRDASPGRNGRRPELSGRRS